MIQSIFGRIPSKTRDMSHTHGGPGLATEDDKNGEKHLLFILSPMTADEEPKKPSS